MLDRRSIPELVRWSTEDCEEGRAEDWLVIENKATTVGQAALHPLSRYVDLLPARVSAQPDRCTARCSRTGPAWTCTRSS